MGEWKKMEPDWGNVYDDNDAEFVRWEKEGEELIVIYEGSEVTKKKGYTIGRGKKEDGTDVVFMMPNMLKAFLGKAVVGQKFLIKYVGKKYDKESGNSSKVFEVSRAL